jgi:uncharacterized membrane protein YphA (DoxX/SURF4 family)
MNPQNLLTDPLLCLFGALFLAGWAGVKHGTKKLLKRGITFDGETFVAALFRVACGLILVFASRDKLGDAASFGQMITDYQILSPSLVPLASLLIPWLEFFAGLCLVFGFRYRGAAFVFCLLMGLYALAIAFDLLRGVDINCGCGLTNPTENATWWSVLRDFLFMGMGFIVLVSPRTYASLDRLNDQKGPS